jgi:AraC-like DNA-binding protein
VEALLAAQLRCCEDLEIPGREIFPSGMDPFAEIAQLTSLDVVRLWFVGLTERIAGYTQTRQENFAQVKVREALEYLESHYADSSLSLQGLCKKLDISMSYFSANLKKYHDKTFVEELTAIRLTKAMELLRTTDLMTYEIADRIGYRDGRYPVIGTWFTDNFEENAYAIAVRILKDHPDLGGFLAMNEVSTIGVAKALRDTGAAGKIRLVGFDSSLTEIQFIEQGVIAATVIQKPFNMGYLAVQAAQDAVENRPLPSFIDTGSVLITVENLYEPENQKLLFPFVE